MVVGRNPEERALAAEERRSRPRFVRARSGNWGSVGADLTKAAVVIVEPKFSFLGAKKYGATIYRLSKGIIGWGLQAGETHFSTDPDVAGQTAKNYAIRDGLTYLGMIQHNMPQLIAAPSLITESKSKASGLGAEKKKKKVLTMPPITISAPAPFVKLAAIGVLE